MRPHAAVRHTWSRRCRFLDYAAIYQSSWSIFCFDSLFSLSLSLVYFRVFLFFRTSARGSLRSWANDRLDKGNMREHYDLGPTRPLAGTKGSRRWLAGSPKTSRARSSMRVRLCVCTTESGGKIQPQIDREREELARVLCIGDLVRPLTVVFAPWPLPFFVTVQYNKQPVAFPANQPPYLFARLPTAGLWNSVCYKTLAYARTCRWEKLGNVHAMMHVAEASIYIYKKNLLYIYIYIYIYMWQIHIYIYICIYVAKKSFFLVFRVDFVFVNRNQADARLIIIYSILENIIVYYIIRKYYTILYYYYSILGNWVDQLVRLLSS